MEPYYQAPDTAVYIGDVLDVLRELPNGCVQCVVTSPPYWGLRDYGINGQLGLEATPEEYTVKMVEIFREVKRVLKDDGTVWLNLGDSYAGSMKGSGGNDPDRSCKQITNRGAYFGNHVDNARSFESNLSPKNMVGIPWRIAFALQSDGWYLRSDIIWSKPNPMPESVTDRPTKAHEYIFLLSKNERYYYDQEAIKEPWSCMREDMAKVGQPRTGAAYLSQGGTASNDNKQDAVSKRTYKGFNERWKQNNPVNMTRNKRTVWEVTTKGFSEAHFATFPEELIKPCILAGCPEGGTVLDPFGGSGTTSVVARSLGRKSIYIDLNTKYADMAIKRLEGVPLSMPMNADSAS